ncbi:hypothetical protein Tco_1397360 [Tanacetum coccineum]
MPHDSPLPRVNTLGSDEGNMSLQELTVFYTQLSKKVESLEADLKQTKQVYGAAYTKLNMKVKKLEKTGRYDQDMEFNFEVSTAEDVSTAKPVSTAGAAVTIASVAICTASPLRVSTADDITLVETLVYIRRNAAKDKGKAKMDESEQRIARVHEEASSFKVEKWEDIQARIQADEELVQRAEERRNKPLTQAQQRTYMSNYIKHMGSHTLQQLRGYSFNDIKALFETTMRRVSTFVPIDSEDDKAVPELAGESLKRHAEEKLDQEISKRQKIGESSRLAEESRDKDADELSQEEIYTEGTRKYWKIIRVGNHTEVYQFFDDMPKAFDRDDLVMLWSLVKEKFNSTELTNDKERHIWVELKRLFEPDADDELWKLQKHIHDLTRKLYDSCRVYHVSTKRE